MLKAGIITFHDADNFGAVLQCYALQEFLTRLGVHSCVVGHKDQHVIDFYKPLKWGGNYKENIVSLLQLPANISRKRKFSKFRKEYFVLCDKNDALDLYVCGSDQIWNFDITGGYNPIYFADFDRPADSRAVAYAASIGAEELSEQTKGVFTEKIKNFSKISVREEKAKQLLQSFLGEDMSIEVLPDPTLLIDKEKWRELAKNATQKSAEEYLLLYSLTNCPQTYQVAKRVAKERGIPIIEIRGSARPYKYNPGFLVKDDIGPLEFLSYIMRAAFVVTDSFHGTVFSTVFEKPFYSIPPQGLGSRMVTLLERLGLEQRLVTNDSFVVDDSIDYDLVRQRSCKLQTSAEIFLKSVL